MEFNNTSIRGFNSTEGSIQRNSTELIDVVAQIKTSWFSQQMLKFQTRD